MIYWKPPITPLRTGFNFYWSSAKRLDGTTYWWITVIIKFGKYRTYTRFRTLCHPYLIKDFYIEEPDQGLDSFDAE